MTQLVLIDLKSQREKKTKKIKFQMFEQFASNSICSTNDQILLQMIRRNFMRVHTFGFCHRNKSDHILRQNTLGAVNCEGEKKKFIFFIFVNFYQLKSISSQRR